MKKLPICKKIISSVFLILHFFIVSPFIPLYSETKQSEKHLFELAGQNFLVISIKTNTKIRVAM